MTFQNNHRVKFNCDIQKSFRNSGNRGLILKGGKICNVLVQKELSVIRI